MGMWSLPYEGRGGDEIRIFRTNGRREVM